MCKKNDRLKGTVFRLFLVMYHGLLQNAIT